MSNKRFPRDCTTDCQYFRTWDLSIDDWTCVCDKLHAQIDECDMDFDWMYCPLKEDETATIKPNNEIKETIEETKDELFSKN